MKLSDIKPNPNNPRIIRDAKFDKLVKSIKDFPKMMSLRPIIIDQSGIILGGNMRYQAIKHLKYKDIPDEWVKRAEDLTDEEKEEFIIKDNVGFGEWVVPDLEVHWDVTKLDGWGLDDVGFSVPDKNGEETPPDVKQPRKPFSDNRDTLSISNLLKQYEKILINFSGGKDSIAMLIELLKIVPKEKIECLFVKIPFDYPNLPEYIKFLFNNVFKGIKYKILSNEEVVSKLSQYGFPSGLNRWCNNLMKIKPLDDYHKELKEAKIKFITCIGTRKEESTNRSKMLDRGTWGHTDYLFPIFERTENELVEIINENNIPMHPYYKIFNRLSCFVCPNAAKSHFAGLKSHIPYLYQKSLEYVTEGFKSKTYREAEFGVEILNKIVNCGEFDPVSKYKFNKYWDQ